MVVILGHGAVNAMAQVLKDTEETDLQLGLRLNRDKSKIALTAGLDASPLGLPVVEDVKVLGLGYRVPELTVLDLEGDRAHPLRLLQRRLPSSSCAGDSVGQGTLGGPNRGGL